MPDNPIPFRRMNATLKATRAEVQLLLSVDGIHTPPQFYALFLSMSNMSSNLVNPSRLQLMTQIAVWLRFYRRLIDTLPDANPLKATAQKDFEQLSEPYQSLLEIQPS